MTIRSHRALRATAIAGAMALAAATAAPAREPSGPENLAGLGMMDGACQRLIVAGKDLSKGCQGKLVNTMFKDGRTGFVFITSDSTAVTFSGMDTEATGDHAASVLDHVIVGSPGTAAKDMPARGPAPTPTLMPARATSTAPRARAKAPMARPSCRTARNPRSSASSGNVSMR